MGLYSTKILKHSNLIKCKKCFKITSHLQILKKKFPNYHCKPVKGHGDIGSNIAIFGLAPGLHGANKTGIPFTSDFSGELIRRILQDLDLNDIYISNVVKCYPDKNKPSTEVINNCLYHLKTEINNLSNLKVIITLGSIAYYQVLKTYNLRKNDYLFKHSNIISLDNKILLISSYHCSKLNINTHKIDYDMLRNIFIKAKEISYHE